MDDTAQFNTANLPSRQHSRNFNQTMAISSMVQIRNTLSPLRANNQRNITARTVSPRFQQITFTLNIFNRLLRMRQQRYSRNSTILTRHIMDLFQNPRTIVTGRRQNTIDRTNRPTLINTIRDGQRRIGFAITNTRFMTLTGHLTVRHR